MAETVSPEPYILIVEDDLFLSNIYQKKLAKEQIPAEIVHNGNEALALMATGKKPSLIVLDLIMPGKDGFETLKTLKSTPELRDIPVIVISNLSQEEDEEKVLDMGAEEFLVKVSTPLEAIIDRMKKSLQR